MAPSGVSGRPMAFASPSSLVTMPDAPTRETLGQHAAKAPVEPEERLAVARSARRKAGWSARSPAAPRAAPARLPAGRRSGKGPPHPRAPAFSSAPPGSRPDPGRSRGTAPPARRHGARSRAARRRSYASKAKARSRPGMRPAADLGGLQRDRPRPAHRIDHRLRPVEPHPPQERGRHRLAQGRLSDEPACGRAGGAASPLVSSEIVQRSSSIRAFTAISAVSATAIPAASSAAATSLPRGLVMVECARARQTASTRTGTSGRSQSRHGTLRLRLSSCARCMARKGRHAPKGHGRRKRSTMLARAASPRPPAISTPP